MEENVLFINNLEYENLYSKQKIYLKDEDEDEYLLLKNRFKLSCLNIVKMNKQNYIKIDNCFLHRKNIYYDDITSELDKIIKKVKENGMILKKIHDDTIINEIKVTKDNYYIDYQNLGYKINLEFFKYIYIHVTNDQNKKLIDLYINNNFDKLLEMLIYVVIDYSIVNDKDKTKPILKITFNLELYDFRLIKI